MNSRPPYRPRQEFVTNNTCNLHDKYYRDTQEMRYISTLVVLALCSAVLFAADAPTVVSPFGSEPPAPRDMMTNQSLVILSEAGFSDSFIVEKILLSRTRFDTSPEGLAYLGHKALSEELVQFVLEYSAKPAGVQLAAPVPTIVPMKIATARVLVPLTTAVPASPIVMPLSPPMTPVPMPLGQYARQWYWNPASLGAGAGYVWPGYSQPTYNVPGYPGLRSPALPAAASMPVMAPVAAQYVWLGAR